MAAMRFASLGWSLINSGTLALLADDIFCQNVSAVRGL